MGGGLVARNGRLVALLFLLLAWDDLILSFVGGGPSHALGQLRDDLTGEIDWWKVAFVVAATAVAAWLLLDRRPKLRIDERGILWGAWSSEPIPWSAIREVRVPYGVSQTSFDVVLVHPEVVPSRRLARVLTRLWGAGSKDIVRIAPGDLDHDIDATIDAIDRFRPGVIRRVE